MLEIRPTNRCNLRCPSCVTRGHEFQKNEEGELSKSQWTQVVKDAAKLGVKYIQIVGGGEPLLRPDVVRAVMSEAKQAGMKGFLLTNGTRFTDSLTETAVEVGWDTINISLDAPRQDLNDRLRSAKGSFEKTTDAIRRIVREKNQRRSILPRLCLCPVLSRLNVHLMTEMVELAADLEVESVIFQPVMVPDTPGGKTFALTDDDFNVMRDQIAVIQRLQEETGIQTNVVDLDSSNIGPAATIHSSSGESEHKSHPLLGIPCFAPFFYVGVHYDGSVGGCSIDSVYTAKGNVKNQSLREIFHGESFERFRRGLIDDTRPDYCAGCSGTTLIQMRTMRRLLSDRIGTDPIFAQAR